MKRVQAISPINPFLSESISDNSELQNLFEGVESTHGPFDHSLRSYDVQKEEEEHQGIGVLEAPTPRYGMHHSMVGMYFLLRHKTTASSYRYSPSPPL